MTRNRGAKTMNVVVQKFGGTSVSSRGDLMKCAHRVVKAQQEGYKPVVVVSAAGRRGEPYATDTLVDLAKSIEPNVDVEPRELDLLMTCGEIMSIVRMAQAIKVISGLPTVALAGGQAGIYTDYNFGNARILRIDPSYIQYVLEMGMIPVVAGFQGVTEHGVFGFHGAITTLGRGGSDTTAGALAAATGAQGCEIYTDVDGVMTADPRVVGKKARVLDGVTYEEIKEMAHLGAKVVHPRCAEICEERGIPLRIRRFDSDVRGTIVKESVKNLDGNGHITAITNSPSVTHIRLNISDSRDLSEVEREIYRSLGEGGVSIHFVSRTVNSFEFVVMREHMTAAIDVLDHLFIPIGRGMGNKGQRLYLLGVDRTGPAFRSRRRELGKLHPNVPIMNVAIEIGASRGIVSLVAANAREMPGIIARFLEALAGVGVDVGQTADAQHSASCLVAEENMPKAVTALHDAFALQEGNGLD